MIQSLSRYAPWIMVSVCALLFVGAAHEAHSHSASVRYRECEDLSKSNPALALQKARQWRAQTDSPMAKHCEALALYGNGNYAAAASELEALAHDAAAQKTSLSVSLLLQAASARKSASDPLMATQDLDYAQTLELENTAVKAQLADIKDKNKVSGAIVPLPAK